MKRFIFSKALLPTGWADKVCIEVDEQGLIQKIIPNYQNGKDNPILGYALPGMNNIHSHAFQRAMAGLAEYSTSKSDSFWTWRDIMYRFAAIITAEDLEAIASQIYVEMLKAGYVTVAEFHYLHHSVGALEQQGEPMSRAIMTAAKNSGIGLCHLPVLYMSSGFGGQPLNDKQKRFEHDIDDFLSLLNTLNAQIKSMPNQHLGMAFHSLRAVPENALLECLSQNKITGPIHIHISEQTKEVTDCLSWSGMRPVEWLYHHVNVDEKWCLIHATHINDEEIAMVARSGAVVGLCPTTEANLGDGIFPLKKYMDMGGAIAIGSDSHISISVVEELRLLEYGQRLFYQARNIAVNDEKTHTGENLYHMALKGGSRASSFDNGVLEVGKRADILILDEASPLLLATPDQNIIDRFIFNGNVNPIKHVMVAGEFLIFDYKHSNEVHIKEKFYNTMKRLKNFLD
jgi:formimidoylglutamate deiminase